LLPVSQEGLDAAQGRSGRAHRQPAAISKLLSPRGSQPASNEE
jgi:hypothetical protein